MIVRNDPENVWLLRVTHGRTREHQDTEENRDTAICARHCDH